MVRSKEQKRQVFCGLRRGTLGTVIDDSQMEGAQEASARSRLWTLELSVGRPHGLTHAGKVQGSPGDTSEKWRVHGPGTRYTWAFWRGPLAKHGILVGM